MFNNKIEKQLDKANHRIAELENLLGLKKEFSPLWGDIKKLGTIQKIEKKLNAILEHLNLEYYEEEKKEIGLREKQSLSPNIGQPKKRGRKKGSKNNKK